MNRFGLALLALTLLGVPAEAAAVIGKVSRVQGLAEGATGGAKQALAVGAPIQLDEVVDTGVDARLELTFDDGTVLAVGEQARVTVDRFVYQPAGATNRLSAAITGPFRFVSGKLSKRPGADVSVVTPVATIGIRGTDFWGGPIDGASGVFLIVGRVVVSNGAGTAVLSRSGQGVNIAGPGVAPGAVSLWPTDKVTRALAMVGFR